MRGFALLLIAAAALPGCRSVGRKEGAAEAVDAANLRFEAGEMSTVYAPARGGVFYPRVIVLSSGEWICGFDTNEDGGDSVIKVVISRDEGASWSAPILVAAAPGASLANAQLAERADGEVWLAYRVVTNIDGVCTTILRVSRSADRGRTWEILPNGEIARETQNVYKGVWEPHMGYMGKDFVVMYANDSLAVVDHGQQQTLYLKKWTIRGWSEPYVVSDGRESNSRDGMPVWTRMKDGRYIVVFEASDEAAKYPFVVKARISKNGVDWNGERVLVYRPEKRMKQAGAPYVITLADGTLVASFQTDEDKAKFGVDVSEAKLVAAPPSASSWSAPFTAFPTTETTHAYWNSLAALPDGGFLAITSTDYPAPAIALRRMAVRH